MEQREQSSASGGAQAVASLVCYKCYFQAASICPVPRYGWLLSSPRPWGPGRKMEPSFLQQFSVRCMCGAFPAMGLFNHVVLLTTAYVSI